MKKKKTKPLLEGDMTPAKRPLKANGGVATQRERVAECAVSSPNSGLVYQVILDTSGIKYQQEGATIDAALAALGLDWNQVKAKGVVTVRQGKRQYEHLFYLKQLRHIFANKLTRLMWAKRLELLLREGKESNTA